MISPTSICFYRKRKKFHFLVQLESFRMYAKVRQKHIFIFSCFYRYAIIWLCRRFQPTRLRKNLVSQQKHDSTVDSPIITDHGYLIDILMSIWIMCLKFKFLLFQIYMLEYWYFILFFSLMTNCLDNLCFCSEKIKIIYWKYLIMNWV